MTRTYNLIEICNIEKGKTGIKSAIPGNYPLVVTSEVRQTSNIYQFDCEAVCIPLVSSTGHGHASIKRIHYQKGKFALGSILCAITPKDTKKVSAKYLYIYLSLNKEKLLVSLMKGAANVSLNINKLNTVQIPIPSIEVQRKIIETFDSVTQKTATILSSIDKDIGLISLLKETLLNTAIQGKLVPQDGDDEDAGILLEKIKSEKEKLIKEGKTKRDKLLPEIKPEEIPFDIPRSWKWIRFSDYFDFQGGSQPPKSHFTSEFKPNYIRLFQIRDFGKKPQPIYVDKSSVSKFFKENDVLLARYGASLGKVFIADQTGAYNVAIVKIIDDKKLTIPKYLYYFFVGSTYQTFIKLASRSAQAGFNKGDFNRLLFPLPPNPEQQRIVERIDQLMLLIDQLEQKLNQSKELTSKLNEVILNETLGS